MHVAVVLLIDAVVDELDAVGTRREKPLATDLAHAVWHGGIPADHGAVDHQRIDRIAPHRGGIGHAAVGEQALGRHVEGTGQPNHPLAFEPQEAEKATGSRFLGVHGPGPRRGFSAAEHGLDRPGDPGVGFATAAGDGLRHALVARQRQPLERIGHQNHRPAVLAGQKRHDFIRMLDHEP